MDQVLDPKSCCYSSGMTLQRTRLHGACRRSWDASTKALVAAGRRSFNHTHSLFRIYFLPYIQSFFHLPSMPSFAALGAALVAAASVVSAQSVSGKPEGFGSKATGGAGGKTVTPTTTEELENYLTSSEALTVVLAQTFDFRGTEGTASEKGCAPYGTGSACQVAINKDDWYDTEECKRMTGTLC